MRKLLVIGSVVFLTGIAGTAKAKAQSGTTDRSPGGVTCASDDGHRHYCQIDTRRGIQMVKQRSGSPCVQGQTWGYDGRGVWVDRGCRAEFAVGNGGPGFGGPGYGGPGNRPGNGYGPGGPGNGWNGPGNGPGGPGYGGQVVTCSSDDGHRHRCGANVRGGVRLVNQRSGSPCVQGRTWGYDNRGIWVDRGCRADFAVGGGR